ncbi:MAG: DUF1552 domain-containing protein [Myxococcota bacterium]
MNRIPPSRRHFLAGLGAASLLPFVPTLESEAEADDTTRPKRLLLFWHPFGGHREFWVPEGDGEDFEIQTGPHSILAPLRDHRDDLIIVDGVRHRTSGPGDQHQKAAAGSFTGASIQPDGDFKIGGQDGKVGWANGVSVDQVVAERLAQQNRNPFRSLELAVDTTRNDVRSRIIYRGPGDPVAPETDPRTVYDRVFATASLSEEDRERIRAERLNTLDFVYGDVQRFARRVGRSDRHRIDQHLNAVDAIHGRVEAGLHACAVTPPELDDDDIDTSAGFPHVAKAQIDMMVAAMACDLTRVGSIQLKDEHGRHLSWIPGIAENSFHSLSHGHRYSHSLSKLREINKVDYFLPFISFSEQFAYLLEQLKARPEGNGTMLDHTLVVWGTGLGHGDHDLSLPCPWIFAGGGLRGGRLLNKGGSIDHNRLLVSICHRMGVEEVSTFGDNGRGQGPYAALV